MTLQDFQLDAYDGKIPPPLNLKCEPRQKADMLKKFVDGGLYDDNALRRRDMATNRRAELFDQGAQQLKRASGTWDSGGGYSSWVDTYWHDSTVPKTVFNEGIGARQNESARLARPNYRPLVSPRGPNPDLQARLGSKKMQDMLRHELRSMDADKDMGTYYYHLPLYGGAWLKSEISLTWDHVGPVPALGAVGCPEEGCDFKLASPEVPAAQAMALGQPPAPGMKSARIQTCPQCAQAEPTPVTDPTTGQPAMDPMGMPMMEGGPKTVPLQVFRPTLEEATSSTDSIGRPLGSEQPLGDWKVSIRHDSNMFPRNMGYDMEPGRIDEWTERHLEHVDWVGLRWPDKVGDVKPESAAALAKLHPVAGMPDIYSSVLGGKMFEQFCIIKERHKKPWMECVTDDKGEPVKGPDGKNQYKLNKGRSVIMAGDVVLLDGTYLVQSLTKPGKWIPRVLVEYTPFEFRDGGRRLRGLGLWERMFDPQIVANDIRSQTQAVRQRMAVPIYLCLKSQQLEIAAMKGGIPGLLAQIETEPGDEPFIPKVFNNETINPDVEHELSDAITFLQRAGRLVDVEQGRAEPGVSAASALELLKGAAEEGRESLLNRIQESLKRMWDHGTEIIQSFYIEPREVKGEDSDGEEEWSMMMATDFAGDFEVSVEAEPDYSEKIQTKELTREMFSQGYFGDPTMLAPSQRRKISKLIGGPDDLWEKEDLQTSAAQREDTYFKKEGRVPVVDTTLDDHNQHNEIHGSFAMNEWFRDLEERCAWDEALRLIGGGLPWIEMQAMAPSWECAQDRYYMAISSTLQMAGFQSPDPEAFEQVLQFRSHMAGHRIESAALQMQAQGMPVQAAPGAEETESGNQVTESAPPDAQSQGMVQ